ncbi:MAG: class I SAM-dependent methyltransferase [Aquabacterium sp.]
MHDALAQQAFWEQAWVRHLEAYLAQPPRAGLWLVARFGLPRLRGWTVLELAGGSCRDARHLARLGVRAIGSDFDQRTLDYLAQRFPGDALTLQREDAAALSLADGAVDLSLHNGFWVLFSDDDRIAALLREQARVTRGVLVALVHNAGNPRQRAAFARKAQDDPLYDIRFFTPDELLALVAASGIAAARVRIEKFGGPIDRLLRLPGPFRRPMQWLVPRLYRWLPWRQVERIALVIER